MASLKAYLSHPLVDYKFAYTLGNPYIKGLLYKFPPESFQVCEEESIEVVKQINFSQLSWSLLDTFIKRYEDKPALRDILFERRLAQLDFPSVVVRKKICARCCFNLSRFEQART